MQEEEARMNIAVITGASGGLGLALAGEFSAQGWQVVGTGRSTAPADFPKNASYESFDASNSQGCDVFWAQLHQQYPDASICLINNAGGYVGGNLADTTYIDFEQQLRSSYLSSAFMTKAFTGVFSKGKIINIVSSTALNPHKGFSAYGAAKAAQSHFFRSLQDEFEPAAYRITNVYPDDMATHGEDEFAIVPGDIARFIREQAENDSSYYVSDVSVSPMRRR